MTKYLSFLLFLLLKAGTATAQNNLIVNGIPYPRFLMLFFG